MANLLLARAMSRQREIAIRASLSAGRRHIVRQLLTESVLLSILGGAVGVLIAMWGIDLLKSFSPSNIPRLDNFQIDLTVLGFTMGIALLTGVLVGLAPGWAAVKHNLYVSLKEGGHGASPPNYSRRLRNLLFVSEVALSLVLLVAAGLMLKSCERPSTLQV
jgi:putative ABC transport system permease protein